MTQVTLTPREVAYAATAGIYRYMAAVRRQRPQMEGQPARGRWDTDIEGCCAEMALAKCLDRYWSGASETGDVGRYEVRSSPYPDAHLIILERDADDAPFVLVTGNAPDFQVRGWILGRDAKRDHYYRGGACGHKPAYWVPQSALEPISELLSETGLLV